MQAQANLVAEVRAFMKSRVILTAAELDLFTHLEQGFVSVKELVARLDLDERATTRLLDCLITFGLLEKQGDRYRTTSLGALLSARHPESILPSVRHSNRLWHTWSQLTATVKAGQNSPLKSSGERLSEEERQDFIGAMHVGARQLAGQIGQAYDTQSFKRLLDIGGGSGAYTIAFLQKNPNLQAILFDLPGVIPMARANVRAAHLEDRVSFVAGDYNQDDLPGGCDLVLLSAIIHSNSPARNLRLFQKIYQALEEGGVVLIRDYIMDPSRTQPAGGALFALNMLVGPPGGDTYTLAEVQDGLTRAGFAEVRLIASGQRMDSLVEARKSGQV